MRRLFESATLKLTGWYLLILALISLMFSIIVYQISIGEVERRLLRYEEHASQLVTRLLPALGDTRLRQTELSEAKASVIIVLINTNIIVLAVGGIGSYLLARRTLQPIEEAHEQQSRFVSDASHELRTPLAAMTTELEVALGDPSLSKAEMRELLTSNLEEVGRLTALSQTLLALSSGQTDTLVFEKFSLTASVRALVERYDPAGTRLQLEAPTRDLLVSGHQASIEELITILIDNALTHSPEDSPVALHLTRRAGRAELRLTNTGPGIPSEHLPRIFDRFYRADTSRTGHSGHGLGLALARQISNLHKAGLSARSTPGKTTEFWFSLPLARTHK